MGGAGDFVVERIRDPGMYLAVVVKGAALCEANWLRGLARHDQLTPLLAAYSDERCDVAPTATPDMGE